MAKNKLMAIAWMGIGFFGKDNLDKGFAIHRAILKLLGLAWWNEGFLSRVYTATVIVVSAVHNIGILRMIFGTTVDSVDGFTHLLLLQVILLVFTSGNLKHLIFLLFRQRVATLIRYMEEELPDDGVLLPGLKNYTMYGFQLSTTGAGWVMNGLFAQDDRFKGLLWGCDFPWDSTHGIGNLIGITWQVFCAQLCWMQQFCLDTVPTVVGAKLVLKIDQLRILLSKIGTRQNDHQILTEAIRLHVAILKGIRLLNKAYEYILMFQVIYLVLHSCVIVYCVVKIDSYGLIITSLVPMMISAYFQLFMYCHVGQSLTSEMDALTWSCYNNKWYLSTVSSQKTLNLMLECTKKPVRFQSFGVSAALYETYLKSVKESFSYFVFLRTLSTNMQNGEDNL